MKVWTRGQATQWLWVGWVRTHMPGRLLAAVGLKTFSGIPAVTPPDGDMHLWRSVGSAALELLDTWEDFWDLYESTVFGKVSGDRYEV